MREVIAHGKPSTPFLKVGDLVRIEVVAPDGSTPFGTIEQRVVAP
jgi:fumarylacetoacetate (FAA) hydrolase